MRRTGAGPATGPRFGWGRRLYGGTSDPVFGFDSSVSSSAWSPTRATGRADGATDDRAGRSGDRAADGPHRPARRPRHRHPSRPRRRPGGLTGHGATGRADDPADGGADGPADGHPDRCAAERAGARTDGLAAVLLVFRGGPSRISGRSRSSAGRRRAVFRVPSRTWSDIRASPWAGKAPTARNGPRTIGVDAPNLKSRRTRQHIVRRPSPISGVSGRDLGSCPLRPASRRRARPGPPSERSEREGPGRARRKAGRAPRDERAQTAVGSAFSDRPRARDRLRRLVGRHRAAAASSHTAAAAICGGSISNSARSALAGIASPEAVRPERHE